MSASVGQQHRGSGDDTPGKNAGQMDHYRKKEGERFIFVNICVFMVCVSACDWAVLHHSRGYKGVLSLLASSGLISVLSGQY